MTQPNYNSEGQQVWDPSVGLHFSPGSENAESYGGIVTALQDQIVAAGGTTKGYPYSYAGIISAIQDLTFAATDPPQAEIGPQPPGGNVVIDSSGNPNWIVTEPPNDGALWFDTRQGRMMIAYSTQWYQTNGADGVPIVTDDGTPPPTSNIIVGQFWYRQDTDALYIFAGTYTTPSGGTTTDPSIPGVTPIWLQVSVSAADYIQNTSTLPLTPITAVSTGYLPPIDPTDLNFQRDANLWFVDALEALDVAAVGNTIAFGESAPANPTVGKLWYDTSDLELSIWYVDPEDTGSEGQWVPTSASYAFNSAISNVTNLLNAEVAARTTAVMNLTSLFTAVKNAVIASTDYASLKSALLSALSTV